MIRNLSKRLAITIGLISVIGLSGCAVKYDNVAFDPVSKRTIVKNMDAATQNEINAVAKKLMTLGPNIDPQEAQLLAHEAVA